MVAPGAGVGEDAGLDRPLEELVGLASRAHAALGHELGDGFGDAGFAVAGVAEQEDRLAGVDRRAKLLQQACERVFAKLKRKDPLLDIAQKIEGLYRHASTHAALEQAKHYGRLLAEKEAVIQSLSRACAERESVITRLAADSTDSTGLLHRLWLLASTYTREKLWRPFDAWLFTRVVEK